MKARIKKSIVILLLAGMIIPATPRAQAATESASSINEVVKIIRAHALKRESKFSVKYTGSESDIDYMLGENSDQFSSRLSLYDDPNTSDDADYLVGNLNLCDTDDFMVVTGNRIDFKLKYYETSEETEYVNAHIPQILSSLNVDSMSNYEKVLTIHDYVCDLITYLNSNKDSDMTVYGALVYNKAVCNSYALCMYKLLVNAGVPCKYVTGMGGTGRDKDAHAWNIVALGDKWYLLDATWDDQEDEIIYDYFLKGSSDFDSADPSEPHSLFNEYKTGAFAKVFPIAKKAFDPDTMSDENKSVVIGSTLSDDIKIKYKLNDIVDYKYPTSGKFTVKKGKAVDLQLVMKPGSGSLVKKVTVSFTTGKARVKGIKNYGLLTDDDGTKFTDLTFKGKKKGAVNVKITLKLTNGQSLSYTFKGKVK